jgi:hypothetical protein
MEFLFAAIPWMGAAALVVGLSRRAQRRRLVVLKCERRTRLLLEAIRHGF